MKAWLRLAVRRFKRFGRGAAGSAVSLLCALMLSMYSAPSSAGSFSNVTITRIEAETNGHFFVYLSANITNGPSCGQVNPNAFALDASTEAGKAMMAMMIAAYTLNKTVTGIGSNVCDVHGNYETIFDMYTTN